ncbi:MAG: hypothetical protein R3C49_09190 [Planctomycetaceae bacterium]
MSRKPQSLTGARISAGLAFFAIAAVVGTIFPVSVTAQQEAETATAPAATSESSPEALPESAATKLKPSSLVSAEVFDQMTQTLDGVESLSCDLVQNVTLSGQRFQAAGRYLHASGNRMRLEYRIFPVKAATASDAARQALDSEPEDTSKLKPTGSLEQVSDGSVLWSRWANGPQKQVTRRNIREIVESVNGLPNYSEVRSLQDLGVGGLQTLMSQLQLGMEFGPVQETQVGSDTYLVLAGRWNEKTRTEVFKLPADPNAQLPDYIPDYVRIYVDSKAHLPRRIQYLKKHFDPGQKSVRPIVTLDFRNIRLNEELPDDAFNFTGSEKDGPEIDLTSQVIDLIKKQSGNDAAPEPADPPKE